MIVFVIRNAEAQKQIDALSSIDDMKNYKGE